MRKAGDQIEGGGHNLFKILQKFMNAYAPKHAKSFHDIDDSIDLLEEAVKNTSVRMLLAMLRFLYQCVDAFFFHCGDMAIGHNNLFFTMMQLLFRQTGMAEYTQAQARLQQVDTRKRILYETERHEDPLSGLQPLVMRFVHSLQVFFAQQNYPSLLHWFAMVSACIVRLDSFTVLSAVVLLPCGDSDVPVVPDVRQQWMASVSAPNVDGERGGP